MPECLAFNHLTLTFVVVGSNPVHHNMYSSLSACPNIKVKVEVLCPVLQSFVLIEPWLLKLV